MAIDSYYLNDDFAELFYSSIKVNANIREIVKPDSSFNESLAYFDAVDIIRDPNGAKIIRIHIKGENVYIFNHLENELINITEIRWTFPEPRPKFVDSMFFYKDHLNLLSGNYIYSYLYDWAYEKFIFKDLKFKFKFLPTNIESAFSYKEQIYFFKDDEFYVNKIDKDKQDEFDTFRVVGNFLFNCNKIEKPKYFKLNKINGRFLNVRQNVLYSFSNDTEINTQIGRRMNIGQIILISIGIVVLIVLLVFLFMFFEFLSVGKSYLVTSVKMKKKGSILTGSNLSLGEKTWQQILEKEKNKEQMLKRQS